MWCLWGLLLLLVWSVQAEDPWVGQPRTGDGAHPAAFYVLAPFPSASSPYLWLQPVPTVSACVWRTDPPLSHAPEVRPRGPDDPDTQVVRLSLPDAWFAADGTSRDLDVWCDGQVNTLTTWHGAASGADGPCPWTWGAIRQSPWRRLGRPVRRATTDPRCQEEYVTWYAHPRNGTASAALSAWVQGPDRVWWWRLHDQPSWQDHAQWPGDQGGTQLTWRVLPWSSACTPTAWTVTPRPGCVHPTPFAWGWDWDDDAPRWTAALWGLVFTLYLLGVAWQSWTDAFPRLGTLVTSLLLALHLPLQAHAPFGWYVTACGVALGAAGGTLGWQAYRLLRRSPVTFTLPPARSWEGGVRLCVFGTVQVAVLWVAVWLQA